MEIVLAKLCADVLHYEINCHMIVSSMPWMDDGTDGQDGWMDGKLHEKRPRSPLIYAIKNKKVMRFENRRGQNKKKNKNTKIQIFSISLKYCVEKIIKILIIVGKQI